VARVEGGGGRVARGGAGAGGGGSARAGAARRQRGCGGVCVAAGGGGGRGGGGGACGCGGRRAQGFSPDPPPWRHAECVLDACALLFLLQVLSLLAFLSTQKKSAHTDT
jgi:hypothetical protein